MLPFYVNYRASLYIFLETKKLLRFDAPNEFLIGQDFSAKRSVSVSYKLVSYMRDSTVSLMFSSMNLDWLDLKVQKVSSNSELIDRPI